MLVNYIGLVCERAPFVISKVSAKSRAIPSAFSPNKGVGCIFSKKLVFFRNIQILLDLGSRWNVLVALVIFLSWSVAIQCLLRPSDFVVLLSSINISDFQLYP